MDLHNHSFELGMGEQSIEPRRRGIASPVFSRSREPSFRPKSREGSFKARELSMRSREGSFKARELSMKSREGSGKPRALTSFNSPGSGQLNLSVHEYEVGEQSASSISTPDIELDMHTVGHTDGNTSHLVDTLEDSIHLDKRNSNIVGAILSGLINGLILFVFCCVFSTMIFGQTEHLQQFVPMGVSMNVMSTMVGAALFAFFSGCKAVIAGPDINPTVFVAEAAAIISTQICPIPLDSSGAFTQECKDVEAIIPTILVSTALGTLIIGAVFFCMGQFGLTRVVGYIPSSVTSGFLSCVGYKVMKASLEVSTGHPFKVKYWGLIFGTWKDGWMLLLPALGIGLPLYALKRYHIGKATVNFSMFIVIPTLIFYTILFAVGSSIGEAREEGWYFAEAEGNLFWTHWETTIAGIGQQNVRWEVILSVLPTWAVMILIVCLDDMLKLASTEVALGVDLSYDREMKVGGAATTLNGLLVGMPAYGQTKFNVLNFAIIGNTENNLAGLVTALFCGALFFAGFPLINYLPRFLLGGLLVFSGIGFIIENLFDAYWKMNRITFAGVWMIFLVNIWKGLLYAIVLGLLWAAIDFAHRMARKKVQQLIGMCSQSGLERHSSAIRSEAQQLKLSVIGRWYHVLTWEGFIFFGDASTLYAKFQEIMQKQKTIPRCQRLKYMILDLGEVIGMDNSAAIVFIKMKRLAAEFKLTFVWAGLRPNVETFLHKYNTIGDSPCYTTIDEAEKWVEDKMLSYAHNLSQNWLIDYRVRHIYNTTMLHDAFTSSTHISDGAISPYQLLHWFEKRSVRVGTRILEHSSPCDGLYLILHGRVSVTNAHGEKHTTYPGAFFNEEVFHSSSPGDFKPTTKEESIEAIAVQDSVILFITPEKLTQMKRGAPHLALEIAIAILKQEELRWSGWRRARSREINPHTESTDPEAVQLAKEIWQGDDYQVDLSPFQQCHYRNVFKLHHSADSDVVCISELSAYLGSLGHGLSVEELEDMIISVGINMDGSHTMTEDQFLEFIRSMFVCNLPSARIPHFEQLYEQLSKDSKGITQEQALQLLLMVGFPSHCANISEIFEEVNPKGGGYITFMELLTCMGMIKSDILQIHQLKRGFNKFKNENPLDMSVALGQSLRYPTSPVREEDLQAISTDDLVANLKVSKRVADEMIFVADVFADDQISFYEFKSMVLNWSL